MFASGTSARTILPEGESSMPWIMPSYEAVDRIIDGPIGEQLTGMVRDNRVEPLALAGNGFRQITNNVREITTPADLSGLTKVLGPGFDLKNTIDAMLARYYLIAGKYQQAIDAAGRVDELHDELLRAEGALPGRRRRHLVLLGVDEAQAGLPRPVTEPAPALIHQLRDLLLA